MDIERLKGWERKGERKRDRAGEREKEKERKKEGIGPHYSGLGCSPILNGKLDKEMY